MVKDVHILRKNYSNLFGAKSITSTKKNWFVKNDVLPACVFIFLFVWIAWSNGHLIPLNRVNELRAKIEKTNSYFDDRAKKTLALIDDIRGKLATNELDDLVPLTTGNIRSFLMRRKVVEYLDEIENAVARLSLNKPNDEAIQTRLAAAIEFAELSQEIVNKRDLGQYNLSLNTKPNLDDKADDGQDQSLFDKALGNGKTFTKDALANGSEAKTLIDQGKFSIEMAETYLDPLNDSEQKAKIILAKFDGFVMPRREHELLLYIDKEWQQQYFGLLDHWKQVRTLEIFVDEEIEKRRSLLLKQQKREEEPSVKVQQQAEPEVRGQTVESETRPHSVPTSVSTSTSTAPPTSREDSREEKRRKALDLLN